jgi:hypothetical protein
VGQKKTDKVYRVLLPLALALLAAGPDAPRSFMLVPEGGGTALAAAPSEVPPSLIEARKLADQLRYEESVVEYQRYLSQAGRPAKERASALVELGFIHLVLGDEATASARALEALALDEHPTLLPGAPAREIDWLRSQQQEFTRRARIAVDARRDDDPALLVRITITDPGEKVRWVLLRHARAADGPYEAAPMQCEGGKCSAMLPVSADAADASAWYWVEALDEKKATVAQAGNAQAPLQLSVIGRRPWYQSPLVWGITGAAIVGIAAVVFALSPAPPR